ncbi:hypothetical protein ACSVDM_06300 [Nocardia sp. JW2]|uniref:hypothetical protein n=1 Tax=Nocardia sp. JW2 TaxID=3450738 RepID=UPI003F439422
MSILFHNTMRITEGHTEEFGEAVRRAVAFVREHGPQLMVQVFLDAEAGLAHSFQLYPDSEAVLAHWQMSDPYIQDVMAHCTIESFETFGEMSDAVLEGLRSGPVGAVTVRPLLTGFTRL